MFQVSIEKLSIGGMIARFHLSGYQKLVHQISWFHDSRCKLRQGRLIVDHNFGTTDPAIYGVWELRSWRFRTWNVFKKLCIPLNTPRFSSGHVASILLFFRWKNWVPSSARSMSEAAGAEQCPFSKYQTFDDFGGVIGNMCLLLGGSWWFGTC